LLKSAQWSLQHTEAPVEFYADIDDDLFRTYETNRPLGPAYIG
jgi:hypothetical protein